MSSASGGELMTFANISNNNKFQSDSLPGEPQGSLKGRSFQGRKVLEIW